MILDMKRMHVLSELHQESFKDISNSEILSADNKNTNILYFSSFIHAKERKVRKVTNKTRKFNE